MRLLSTPECLTYCVQALSAHSSARASLALPCFPNGAFISRRRHVCVCSHSCGSRACSYAAYPWLYCPLMQLPVGKYGLNRDFSCTPPPSFQERTYTLLDLFPDVLLQYARATPALLRVMNLLEPLAIDCLPVQWHGLCLAAIASTRRLPIVSRINKQKGREIQKKRWVHFVEARTSST